MTLSSPVTVSGSVKRKLLPKGCDAALEYQALQAAVTGRVNAVVSSWVLPATEVNCRVICETSRVFEKPSTLGVKPPGAVVRETAEITGTPRACVTVTVGPGVGCPPEGVDRELAFGLPGRDGEGDRPATARQLHGGVVDWIGRVRSEHEREGADDRDRIGRSEPDRDEALLTCLNRRGGARSGGGTGDGSIGGERDAGRQGTLRDREGVGCLAPRGADAGGEGRICRAVRWS